MNSMSLILTLAGISVSLAVALEPIIGPKRPAAPDYDTLTAPWRTVIGPIHPDDPTPTDQERQP